ncbi:MAG: enhanced intracellular survival protein Eis [Pseudomonadales bacterium]
MSRIVIRPATDAEMSQVGLITSYVYGGDHGDGEQNTAATRNRAEWTLCAFDGTTMVASYATIPFTMRANGTAMAMGGVSIVGTVPEYRRRGLLRTLTEQSFETMREKGQTVAALWASQAAIYQRFGYSMCSVRRTYEVDTVDVRLLTPAPDDLTVAREPLNEAFDTCKSLYRAFVAERTFYLHRANVLWQANALAARPADGPVHVAICRNGNGEALGYLIYTLRGGGRVNHPARSQEIVIRDFAWLTIDACRALWAFIGCHDLVGRVRWENAPADDPAWELFAEPRMLNARDREGAYFRIVDVPGALTGRGYQSDGECVIAVAPDRETPWNAGTWRLAVSGGQAEVAPTTDAADVTFSIRSLASAFTGFRSVRRLASWGLVDGSEEAIRRADALFATRYAPSCPDNF